MIENTDLMEKKLIADFHDRVKKFIIAYVFVPNETYSNYVDVCALYAYMELHNYLNDEVREQMRKVMVMYDANAKES